MIRILPLLLLAAPASAHPLPASHLHSESMFMLAGGIALVITALGLAFAGARK